MALLQCCFESADYVELIQLEDEGHEGHVTRTLSKIQETRRPRRLPEIICAISVTGLGMAAGALGGERLWAMLRDRTEEWCQDAPTVTALGLDAAHLGKCSHAFYCSHLRSEPSIDSAIAIVSAMIWGPVALYASFGASYFASWTEEEELMELERLYRERGRGESFVLHSWRWCRWAYFVFDILVAMWLRYYLDLYLDIQAMKIFWDHGDSWFFVSNFGGIVLGLLWTAVEFYKILRDEPKDALPGWQVLVVGLLIPMAGLHVTYLSLLSLMMGVKHRFLYISTLAESVLESAVSAFVQTYAVVFSHLKDEDKFDLYTSIALSFVSIGYAFSALDKYDGGELLVKVPGLCRGANAKWWGVFAFRIAEVTSRATSLALFQCVWRPWGIVTIMAADTVLVVTLATLSQMMRGRKYSKGGHRLIRDNLVYALPSSICLMTPMLEKDSPMTLPPELYYSIRVAELGAMISMMGWSLKWDVDAAREIFQDDALIVSAFVISTIFMVLLGFILRGFVAQRTLMEAPVEMWHMRPFNVTQQVLRNRILGVEAGFKSRAWQAEQRRIMAKIQRAPHRASHLQRAMLQSDLPDMSAAEWDARFLSAKVSFCLEQSLHSLASTFLETQKDVKVGGAVAKRFSRKRPEESNQGIDQKSGSETRLAGRGQPLRTGTLVHLRGPGGGLTKTEDNTVVMRWAGDTSDQKFVVEAADELERYGFATEHVPSGGVVRLRALSDASLVRIAAAAADTKDEESGKSESWNLVTAPERGAGDPDCLFSLMLWHEEEYRSARRFALTVRPLNKGCLEVRSFRPSGDVSSDFVDVGWRIAAINGVPATAEDVEGILALAAQDLDDEITSEDAASPKPSMVESAESLRSRTQKFMPARTSTFAASKGVKYRVCFEKAYGSDMVVGLGEKVVLRVASVPGAGAAAGAVVGFGVEIGHGPSGLDTGSGTRAVVVSEAADPLPLMVEAADIGSRDDPALYGWAAEEIRRRAEASQIRASLAEKCRVAVVVGFNSRANGVRGAMQACTRELHLRMLRLLVSLVRGYRETEVQFDSHEEIMEELRFGSVMPDNSQRLTVQAVDAEDGVAAAAGVQPGDELIEAEVDKNGNRDSLHRSTKEIVEVLGLKPQLAAAKSRLPIERFGPPSFARAERGAGVAASPPMTLLFRSPERISVDSGVQKVLVAEAALVAQLLPSWEEISRPEEFGLEAMGSKSATAARLLRHDEFFRLKCSLVTSLLQQGWELRYANFAESAMMIHQNLDALTRETIRVRFPNLDDGTKEGLLSEQLDVLTASWAAVPRAVKEQQPEQLRRLFRHDVELVAMHDAVDTAYKAWTEQTCNEKTIVEMPATLQRFVERLRPPYAIEALSSAWILRAWFTPEHQHEYEMVQRVVSRFTEIYENTEQYWIRKLDGAATRMERTQEQLERALESADMRVALIPSDQAEEELRRIQKLLCPETLVLKSELSLGEGKERQLIPAGLKLMRRGQVSECFKPEVEHVEVYRRLLELSGFGSDLRLLFGGDGYNEARKQASDAIGELGAIIRVVKTAANAFPDVAAQCQELLDKHHKGELRAVTQENKLRIQIQEKEAEEMVRTANIRLMLAEGQKKAAEEKLREAEQERGMAELAKQESQQRADQWWENLQVMAKEKEMLETEKGRLESEKLQWTQVQSLMELEKSELQADIQKAREERRRLEHAAEKWHHTLQTVKAQAEEKEAHLKEIQAILQKQQEEAAAKSSAAEEPSQFTVTQLMSVLSKAFSADPGPGSVPPSAVATAPASPASPVPVPAPEVEDASRAPPSSTMKMLSRLYSTYSAVPGTVAPTVQGAAYATKRGSTARELSAD